MKDYHKAYLSKQTMTEDFFFEALANGFDIHHLDGDHSNNDPDNLVMIYHFDHFAMHGAKGFENRYKDRWMSNEEIHEIKATLGEKAYKLRVSGLLWSEIDEILERQALQLAKFYAEQNNLQWPIVLSKEASDNIKAARKEKHEAKHAARMAHLESLG